MNEMSTTNLYKASSASESASFGTVSKILHWGMALLILSLLAAIEIRGYLPKGILRNNLRDWHIQSGLCVLLLIGVRIGWRSIAITPPILPPLPRVQQLAANFAHWLLYCLMLIIPILGILSIQSRGDPVSFFGYPFPILLGEENGLPYARLIRNIHEYLGNIIIGLLVIHLAAAIFHHVVRRDNVLRRMRPW
jgi:cytochrome b561